LALGIALFGLTALFSGVISRTKARPASPIGGHSFSRSSSCSTVRASAVESPAGNDIPDRITVRYEH
jgi:hypothetical protein